MEAVGGADRRSNPRRYWNLLKGLSGKRVRQAHNQPIKFNNKAFTKRQSIANQFCKQYVNAMPFKKSKESRKTFRDMKINNVINHTAVFFTPVQVIEAIKATKNSTAVGPNDLSALHLKHLGRNGISFLTRLFNLSLQAADIPAIWKASIVVPVPKPGKPLDEGSSYRPISLLCPEVKVLERLLLPELAQSLTPNRTQHGFRPRHSTVTATIPLVTMIARGFNTPKPAARTGLISVDLSKAFDIIERDKLLAKVDATNLSPNLKRWLLAYMRDRKSRVRYQGVFSKWRITKLGVPQGSVISPLLFNFFLADLEIDSTDLNQSYADDLHGAASSRDLDVIADSLNLAAGEIESWVNDNGMAISAPKSTVTLFTPWTKQVNAQLPVQIGGEPIPMEKTPKLLGITLDPTFSFSAHAIAVAKKASSRLKILRALSDSVFGHDKECLLSTYKLFIRSLFDYAAPVVFPNYTRTSIERLQVIQNKSLRLVLGCHSASNIDHLHQECKELPVAQHLRLLSAQFLALSLQPDHPSHLYVTLDRGHRPMKETLRSKCLADVEPYLNGEGVVEIGSYPAVRDSIHTDIVRQTIDTLAPNRVLGRRPPPIDPTEAYLQRQIRVTLSQLRSGHCARLKTYQHHKLGTAPDDLCPDCHIHPHTTAHLFECAANPTPLALSDLWSNTWRVAHFLQSTPSFDFLPSAGPPPPPPRGRRLRPRPPPEPPPAAPQAASGPISPARRSPSPIFTPLSPPLSPFAFDGRPPSLMSLRVGPQAPRHAGSSLSSVKLFSD